MDLSRFKFYVGGKQVSRKYHDKLIAGKAGLTIKFLKGKRGNPYYAFIGEQIRDRGGRLCQNDPLAEYMRDVKRLPLDVTYIMVRQIQHPVLNPVEDLPLTYVFKYERPVR